MNKLERYNQLSDKVAKLKAKAERNKGQLAILTEQLEREGCATIEEAESKIDELTGEIAKDVTVVEKLLKSAEVMMEEVGIDHE